MSEEVLIPPGFHLLGSRERPILFTPEMVRAILAGTKTVTRRPLKAPRWADPDSAFEIDDEGGVEAVCAATGCLAGVPCPYGVPGDRLWVRESVWFRASDGLTVYADGAMRVGRGFVPPPPSGLGDTDLARQGFARRTSIHLPRVASRITLEIVSVRVERLHLITDEDALAEGIERHELRFIGGRHRVRAKGRKVFNCARDAYFDCWDAMYASDPERRSGARPWVWRIEFRRIES